MAPGSLMKYTCICTNVYALVNAIKILISLLVIFGEISYNVHVQSLIKFKATLKFCKKSDFAQN